MPLTFGEIEELKLRQCEFIRTEERIWVPSPGSWMEGWARQRWLERYFGETQVSVASSEAWARLFFTYPVFLLTEEGGKFKELNVDKEWKAKEENKDAES